ncbi:MAG: 50S ribosomal protein L1 [Candidatus Wallbacteria bacterium]|nr:50S ribosomal protein L1 [Candidatus Wallbacteria bacterium]
MPARGKKYRNSESKVDASRAYPVNEAFDLVPETACARFDETVLMSMNLGVDPKYADQQVRSTLVLPHGTGKSKRVLVIAQGDKEKEAREAGADFVGGEDIIEKIQKGWLDFDAVIATPDMMRFVGKIGKVLGPRGMMPNPKVGTATNEVARAISEIKSGKVEFKVDKQGNLHVPIGKISFGSAKLRENFMALYQAIWKAKPSGAKGTYVKSCYISSCMGPAIRVDYNEAKKVMEA